MIAAALIFILAIAGAVLLRQKYKERMASKGSAIENDNNGNSVKSENEELEYIEAMEYEIVTILEDKEAIEGAIERLSLIKPALPAYKHYRVDEFLGRLKPKLQKIKTSELLAYLENNRERISKDRASIKVRLDRLEEWRPSKSDPMRGRYDEALLWLRREICFLDGKSSLRKPLDQIEDLEIEKDSIVAFINEYKEERDISEASKRLEKIKVAMKTKGDSKPKGKPSIRKNGFTFMGKQTFSCGGVMNSMEIYRHVKTSLDFVLIPSGSFIMGSKKSEGQVDSKPRRKVTVKSFLMCRTECTMIAWRIIDEGADFDGRRGGKPMNRVSWKASSDWCDKAGFRLPSEAEWEYACRAGVDGIFCCGDDESIFGSYAWYSENSNKMLHSVATKMPNAFGIYDMHGNIREWCQDLWNESYKGAPTDGSPWKEGNNAFRVHRGGGYINDSESGSCSFRDRDPPIQRWYRRGFRPAVSLD